MQNYLLLYSLYCQSGKPSFSTNRRKEKSFVSSESMGKACWPGFDLKNSFEMNVFIDGKYNDNCSWLEMTLVMLLAQDKGGFYKLP